MVKFLKLEANYKIGEQSTTTKNKKDGRKKFEKRNPHLHKTNVMCRIFKVAGWLDLKGFDKRIHEIEVTETDKSFVGDGKRISKDKFLLAYYQDRYTYKTSNIFKRRGNNK